jgi:hypothetical protein
MIRPFNLDRCHGEASSPLVSQARPLLLSQEQPKLRD